MVDLDDREAITAVICEACSEGMYKGASVQIRECNACMTISCEHGIDTKDGDCAGGCSP